MIQIPPTLVPVLYFALILGATWLVARLASSLVRRLLPQSPPQVVAGAKTAAGVVVWLVGAILAVGELGVAPTVLLVVVGLLGVAVLLAVREQLENFGAKYFSDIYAPFKVGDSIKILEFAGSVTEINPMSTILLTEQGRLISVPNSLFMREALENLSPTAGNEVVVPLSIQPSIELAKFENELMKSLSKLRPRLDKRIPPLLTTKSRTPQTVDLVLTLMLRLPEDREAIVMEVNQRVAEALQRVKGR